MGAVSYRRKRKRINKPSATQCFCIKIKTDIVIFVTKYFESNQELQERGIIVWNVTTAIWKCSEQILRAVFCRFQHAWPITKKACLNLQKRVQFLAMFALAAVMWNCRRMIRKHYRRTSRCIFCGMSVWRFHSIAIGETIKISVQRRMQRRYLAIKSTMVDDFRK